MFRGWHPNRSREALKFFLVFAALQPRIGRPNHRNFFNVDFINKSNSTDSVPVGGATFTLPAT
jgi:hypothetical protein